MAAMKIGVLGAGHLGRIHIQQLKELAEWEVIGFHDIDAERCKVIEAEFGVPAFADPAELIAKAEAVDIVTPTITHHRSASLAMKAGKHVFIEKPLANTIKEADDLVELARQSGVKVQIGHVERFNPAFRAALPPSDRPMFIAPHRLAQVNPRGTDVSVVLDLMIPDIDNVLTGLGSPGKSVRASGVVAVSANADIASARNQIANVYQANRTACRTSLK